MFFQYIYATFSEVVKELRAFKSQFILMSVKAEFRMNYIFKTKKIEKSTSAIAPPNPMAKGVIRFSKFGLLK